MFAAAEELPSEVYFCTHNLSSVSRPCEIKPQVQGRIRFVTQPRCSCMCWHEAVGRAKLFLLACPTYEPRAVVDSLVGLFELAKPRCGQGRVSGAPGLPKQGEAELCWRNASGERNFQKCTLGMSFSKFAKEHQFGKQIVASSVLSNAFPSSSP